MDKDYNSLNLFYPTTLNIFTDASVKRLPDKSYITSYGYSSYMGQLPIYTNSFVSYGTNNFGEAAAILVGVQEAIRLRNSNFKMNGYGIQRINLFSDSKISLIGVRDWMFPWVYKAPPGNVLYTSSGSPVANQEILASIAKIILENDLRICLYHNLGHININNEEQLAEAKTSFTTINKMHVNDMEIRFIASANNFIDNYTRVNLDKPICNVGYMGFYAIPQKKEMKRYRQLTNKKFN